MQPITLTLKGVKAAGLAAFRDRRLSAQGPTPECAYRDTSGLPCVVGAAMTDEQVAALKDSSNNHTSIWALVDSGKVRVSRGATHGKLKELQAAHDQWARNVGLGAPVAGADLETLRLLKAL